MNDLPLVKSMSGITMRHKNSFWITFWVSLFLLIGLGIRLYDLTDLPLDFHATRQLFSALKARGLYAAFATNMPEWQRQIAIRQWREIGIIEPPIMEFLVAQTYRFTGLQLWVARIYSSLFWVLGGLPVFWLGRRLGRNWVIGLIALGVYLSVPYGGIASRSFQPDPLMVSLMVWAWWGAYTWYESPTFQRAVVAGLLAGLAILVKNLVVFLVLPPLLLLLFERYHWQIWRQPQAWVILILSVLPTGVYTIYGVWISGFLKSQFSGRFFPQLWIDPVFYIRWLGQIEHVVGSRYLFALGLAGIFLSASPTHRRWLLILWLGYFALGFAFSYHYMTHDYYHLPLIPLMALSISPVVDTVYQRLRELTFSKFATAVLIGVLVILFANNLWDIRVTLKRNDYRHEASFWATLGEKLANGSVMALTHDYGYRLAYWGWKDAGIWPTQGDLFLRQLSGSSPEDILHEFQAHIEGFDYFLITLMGEYENQPVLKQTLEQHYTLLDQGDGYLIFDLRHPKGTP